MSSNKKYNTEVVMPLPGLGNRLPIDKKGIDLLMSKSIKPLDMKAKEFLIRNPNIFFTKNVEVQQK